MKTFRGWRDQQLPDGTGIRAMYPPWLARVAVSNPVGGTRLNFYNVEIQTGRISRAS
jgi:hypothetical protein